jgi:hypothetical protein
MAGEITPRNPVTLLPLQTLPDGWDWLVSLDDADTFVKARGMGWSCTGIVEHLATQSTPPSIALMEQNPQLFTSKHPASPLPAASSGAPESTESPSPITLSEGKRGITKAEILDAKWPLPNDAPSLENILDKIPKWVDEACIKVGRAGKGQSGSHLWSPAVLAVCLATRTPHKQWICNQVALTNLIRSQFPDYLDEWTNKQEML